MSGVRIRHITIDVPFDEAYGFAHLPESFSRWATGLASSLRQTDRGWVASTPQGDAVVTFTPPNGFGVLDHTVTFDDGREVLVPLRLLPHRSVTEVELVLFRQPDMTDDDFGRDVASVDVDLRTLKRLLEERAAGARRSRGER